MNVTKKIMVAILAVALIAAVSVGLFACGNNASGKMSNPYPQGMKNFPAMINALNTKAIDGYVAEEPGAVENCASNPAFTYIHLVNNETGFTCTEEDTAIAVGLKKGSALTAQVNAALAKISESERLQMMLTATNYSSGTTVVADSDVETPDYTDDEYGSNTENGKLYVGLECAYAPFNYTQTDNSNGAVPIYNPNKEIVANNYANGYDVMIAKKIAQELHMELCIVKLAWGGLIPALEAGTIDMIIAGMSPTAERKETIDFSDNYYNSQLVIVVRKDGKYAKATSLADLQGAKITAQIGTFHLDALNAYIESLNEETAE